MIDDLISLRIKFGKGVVLFNKKNSISRVSITKWSGRQDLNLQPLGPKPSALPS